MIGESSLFPCCLVYVLMLQPRSLTGTHSYLLTYCSCPIIRYGRANQQLTSARFFHPLIMFSEMIWESSMLRAACMPFGNRQPFQDTDLQHSLAAINPIMSRLASRYW